MIEEGKTYKIKKIRGLDTDDNSNKNLATVLKIVKSSNEQLGDVAFCNVDGERYVLPLDALVDPENPEEYSKWTISKLESVMRPMNLTFWKDLQEEATFSAMGAAPCPAMGQVNSGTGCTVNGVPVEGKSVKKKKRKKHEALELVAEQDPEVQIGDTYFAHNEQDVFDCLDKMIPGDATGVYLKHKEYPETYELTIEMLDEDLYNLFLEEDTEANSDDWEGKNVMDTDPINKERAIETINSLFMDYKVVESKIDESMESFVKGLLEDFHEAYERITNLLAKQLDRMNFEYANTEEIIYKKEGAYRYLLKFDNEIGILKFKVTKDDETIIEKEWQLDEKEDVSPIFAEIEDIYNKYGI